MRSDKVFTDQLGRKIILNQTPARIISTVPSQTELLFYLGLQDKIVGITKYCTHPADKVMPVTKIGGTKLLDLSLINSLKPDLIIANKEENERSQIEELASRYPVWVSDVDDLYSALKMIGNIGDITGTQARAAELIGSINRSFNSLLPLKAALSAIYLIWRKPYMLAGKGTYISDMLLRCGLANATENNRYPEVSREELIRLDPEIVLLSSEPYPFKRKHADELREFLPNALFYLVNGEMFSWYGSRLQHAASYFTEMIQRIGDGIE